MAQLDPSRYKKLTGSVTYGQSDGLYYDTTTGALILVIADTVRAKFPASQSAGQLLLSDGTDIELTTASDDVSVSGAGALTIGAGAVSPLMLSKPRFRVIEETLTAASLTDGGAAVGTKTMTATIPAGSKFLFSTVTDITGFAGDVSATLKLGDGTDDDRYNTGTPSIFTTAAQGVDMGAASGTAWHTVDKAVVATVTSNADITPVLAGGGSLKVQLWFLEAK